jgi:hypothetical protein
MQWQKAWGHSPANHLISRAAFNGLQISRIWKLRALRQFAKTKPMVRWCNKVVADWWWVCCPKESLFVLLRTICGRNLHTRIKIWRGLNSCKPVARQKERERMLQMKFSEQQKRAWGFLVHRGKMSCKFGSAFFLKCLVCRSNLWDVNKSTKRYVKSFNRLENVIGIGIKMRAE